MIKNKLHGVINKSEIESAFKKHKFLIKTYLNNKNKIIIVVEKNYSIDFNIEFNGLIKLKIIINKEMYNNFCIMTYPLFKELSNIIPKKGFNHVYPNGDLCYAPPKRPLVEKWRFEDFVQAVDALIYNYFNVEYIGTSGLFELEHGQKGLEQFEFICLKNKKYSK